MRLRALFALGAAGLAGCGGTTGSDLVTFGAAAAGPEDATEGQPLEFMAGSYHVVLTTATLHVGALYLDQSVPVSGAQATGCILPGVYVAQVTHGLDVNLLSGSPQTFPRRGEGIGSPALVGEVWLVHGDINEVDDPTPLFAVEGSADRDGQTYPFSGKIRLGNNRLMQGTDAAQPGAHPICKERIVSPIPVTLTPRGTGGLLLRVDPRILFENVDFSALAKTSEAPPRYEFNDISSGSPSIRLYQALHSARADLYRFEWVDGL
jgi:hypothetical protein